MILLKDAKKSREMKSARRVAEDLLEGCRLSDTSFEDNMKAVAIQFEGDAVRPEYASLRNEDIVVLVKVHTIKVLKKYEPLQRFHMEVLLEECPFEGRYSLTFIFRLWD